MSDWPEHSQELARKALTTLESLLLKNEEGEVSSEQLWVALDAMCDTIQGLVPAEAFDMIYSVRQAIRRNQ
jgi:hypothetical protein